MDYSKVKELLDKLEEFESLGSENVQLKDFAAWLHAQYVAKEEIEKDQEYFGRGENINSVLGKMIGFMYRYSKFYTKKALANSPFQTMDEFVFVIAVFQSPGISKMELISLNHIEKTTGMEIIKRLISNGMIAQEPHEKDKRSKALKATTKGQMALFETFPLLQQVADLIGGDLTVVEKKQLFLLLRKLDVFHLPIMENFKEEKIESILEQHLAR